MAKVSIIGAGNLGAAIAYEVATRGIAEEIIVVDILKDLAAGQALDIQQALPSHNRVLVRAGEYPEIAHSDIIVITAGKPRTPEMKDRLDLAGVNSKILASIIGEIKRYSPESILITITNPLDVMNHFIFRQGFERRCVIGSAGQLDSARFRIALGYPHTEVEAFVLGEHGGDQVPLFSQVLVDGQKKVHTAEERQKLRQELVLSSMEVVKRKGATMFAPGFHTANIVDAVLRDTRRVMICSANLQGEYGLRGISLGVPCILGKKGIEKIEEWDLLPEELQQLQQAGQKLKECYASLALLP